MVNDGIKDGCVVDLRVLFVANEYWLLLKKLGDIASGCMDVVCSKRCVV